MITIEDIKEYFEVELKADMDRFEARRVAAHKTPYVGYRRTLKILGILWVVFVIGAFISNDKIVSIMLGAIPSWTLFIYAIAKPFSIGLKAKAQFKIIASECQNFVLPKLVSFIGPDFKLHANSGMERIDFKDSLLFPKAELNKFKAHSFVSFAINDHSIEASFINDTYQDEGTEGDNFRGVFARVKLFFENEVYTIIKPNTQVTRSSKVLLGKTVGGLVDQLGSTIDSFTAEKKITTGNPDFDYHLDLYTPNRKASMELLSEPLCEQLIIAAVQSKNNCYFSFVESYLNIYVFDYRLFKWENVNEPVNSFDRFEGYCLALIAIANIAASIKRRS